MSVRLIGKLESMPQILVASTSRGGPQLSLTVRLPALLSHWLAHPFFPSLWNLSYSLSLHPVSLITTSHSSFFGRKHCAYVKETMIDCFSS